MDWSIVRTAPVLSLTRAAIVTSMPLSAAMAFDRSWSLPSLSSQAA